jgi:hypothetical protein
MKIFAPALLGLVLTHTAWAAEPAPPAIVSPAPGATVSSPVTVALSSGGGDESMPDMPGMAGHGHFHLLVDAPLPPPGKPIPMDAHHIHLMHGETTVRLNLPPGPHTIQLVSGTAGHTVAAGAPHSSAVSFTVK